MTMNDSKGKKLQEFEQAIDQLNRMDVPNLINELKECDLPPALEAMERFEAMNEKIKIASQSFRVYVDGQDVENESG